MAKPRYPSEKLDQYMLRLPDGMRDRIKAAAEANNRSMNAEIVATLEEKYPASDFDLGTFIETWSRRMKSMKDPMEAARLASLANKELEAADSEWRLRVAIEGKQFFVRFYNASDPASTDTP